MILFSVAAALATPQSCQIDAAAALVAVHEAARTAHLKGDARLLAASAADTIVFAEDGGVQVRTKADIEKFFAGYFKRVRYSEWSDTSPPSVSISSDGQMAWMAVGIAARYTSVEKPDEGEKAFTSSWIATYKREGCDWRMTGMASDVVE